MDKFQLCSQDEYGIRAIIYTTENIEKAITEGKKKVNEVNVNNALTAEEKKLNWEAYLVQFVPSSKNNKGYTYAGIGNRGIPQFYKNSDFSLFDHQEDKDLKGEIKIYLGKLDGEDWYATDSKKSSVNKITHPVLQDKTCYFIRKV